MTYTNFNLLEKNPQAIITQNTSAQTTPTSANSYVTINGSEITYTPVTGSSKVIYEIGFYVEALNKAAFQHIVLEQNTGTWSTIDNKFGRNFGLSGSTGQFIRDYLYYRFIIPSWSGSRQLRLRSSTHVNNLNVTYHQMTTWDGTGSVTNKFCNTSLFVYSI
tara:strand:+ start:745 stop:1230 length:486 start_codon:yes stop_codon:yes gene_type:complete